MVVNKNDNNKMRLAKFLAKAGVASRRHSEKIIKQGKIIVNSKKITEVVFFVDPNKDVVKYKGQVLKLAKPIYLLLNKPKGYVCTHNRQKDQKIVFDLLADELKNKKLIIVGRLDKDSRGLLLLTNDGNLANKLMHPRREKEKEYLVTVNKNFLLKHRSQLLKGVFINNKLYKARKVVLTDKNQLKIVLTEGKKRQIRLMLEELGYKVRDLVRLRIANLRLKSLAEGEYRELTPLELSKLKEAL